MTMMAFSHLEGPHKAKERFSMPSPRVRKRREQNHNTVNQASGLHLYLVLGQVSLLELVS